ncbi:hypothetical protein [Streptomyces decoyicus]
MAEELGCIRGRCTVGSRGPGARGQEYPENFHSATINNRDGTHFALFHAQYPPSSSWTNSLAGTPWSFHEPLVWADTLSDFAFTVLSASLLLSPLAEAGTSALSTVECKRIKY